MNLHGLSQGDVNVILVTERLLRSNLLQDCPDFVDKSAEAIQNRDPKAIREYVTDLMSARDEQEETETVIVLASNPILINEFIQRLDYDYFYVLNKDGTEFIQITKIHCEDYLVHFYVEDLYAREEFEQ